MRPSTKQGGAFYQIYSFDATRHKDELSRFWDQKAKGQGHDNTTYGQKGGCIYIDRSPIKFYLVMG